MSIWIGAKDTVDSFMKPGHWLGYGDRLNVVKLDYIRSKLWLQSTELS